MTTQADKDFSEWKAFHQPQLDRSQIPESLHRKLFQKLKFEDFDINQIAKILLDQDEERVNLMAIKALQKHSDVFLVDHAWSFRFQDASNTLLNSEKLTDRLEKLSEFSSKLDIPQTTEESKVQKDAQSVFNKQMEAGGRVIELDDMGISVLSQFAWPENLEELSLIGNEIINPNEVAKYIVPLPNIKALWLNANPVVSACSNFSSISELMPTLEIINSKFTNQAGEWALLYYSRSQGATSLEQIQSLQLAGRGLTYLKDLTVLERMKNLKRLDISDHPEFFMCQEKKEALEFQSLIGIDREQKKGVTFVGQNFTIQEVLPKLKYIQELVCDEDLEEYLIENRTQLNLMPDLALINGVSTSVTDLDLRKRQKKINTLFNKLNKFSNQYFVGEGALSQPVWYVQDEVGSAIQHSDKPNVKVVPFMYSPNNSATDPNAVSFNILWPCGDIAPNDGIYRDFLNGISEEQFRSARLHTWFDTPDYFYTNSLKSLRAKNLQYDVEGEHNRIQENTPLRGSINEEKLKVFTEDKFQMSTLTDSRFEFVSTPEEADVCWALGLFRQTQIKQAKEKGSVYINQFPDDDVLLITDLLASLMHSTYSCFCKEKKILDNYNVLPESYFVNTQLPAFMGRYKELESEDLPSVWKVTSGTKISHMPLISANLDWLLRLSESNTLVQKYQRRPYLVNKKKAIFRFSVILKSVVPLQAYVSKKVTIMTAVQDWTLAQTQMGNDSVHICSQQSDISFDQVQNHEEIYSMAVNQIRAVLRALQVQFGEEISAVGEQMSRAIYTCDIQATQDLNEQELLEFGFMPPAQFDYNAAFKCLFFDECADMTAI